MKEWVFKTFINILKKQGFWILIAVAGSFSSVVSLFIDINATVSVKWLLFLIWLSLTLGIIFIKTIYVIASVQKYPEKTKILKVIDDKQVIVIKTN